jgi:hypothetical protein
MQAVATMQHCGRPRRLTAFIYPDWHSARRRYENDLRLLREGIEAGRLAPPRDAPLPARSPTQPASPSSKVAGPPPAAPPPEG